MKLVIIESPFAATTIVSHWDADDEGKVHPDLIDAARDVLRKAKEAGL